MLRQIKHTMVGFGLGPCNTLLARWIGSSQFQKEASLYIMSGQYIKALSGYSMVVVSDQCDNSNKQELPFQTIIGETFFANHINDTGDVLCHALHAISHQFCDVLWVNCPTPMDTLTPDELDFFEEIYNQRLAYAVAPTLHDRFPRALEDYNIYQNDQSTPAQLSALSLLTLTPSSHVEELNQLHRWLYGADPFNQATFDQYIQTCVELVEYPQVNEMIS